MQITSALDYVNRRYTSKDRVLLINPPVVEARYQWSRWNQPLDLLKLSSFLKEQFGCEVKLYDFMLPVGGKVTRVVNKPESSIEIDKYSFPMWRWGVKEEEFSKWFDRLLLSWRPTDIWITSLTTYWWRGVKKTVINLKNIFPDANVVLYGQYPTLETEHAEQNSFANVLISDKFDLTNYVADFSLYEGHKPEFCALDARNKEWHKEVLEKFASGINDFVFFNDPVIDQSSERFLRELRTVREQVSSVSSKKRLKFYGICGLYPEYFNEHAAKAMKEAGFIELHFEYQPKGETLDLDVYKRARESYDLAEFNLMPDQLSGFVNIGLPDDNLERIINHALNIIEVFGSVILKPYTPTPGTPDYESYKDRLETKRIEQLSPHFFPFSKISGVTLDDYEELYTLAASLNRKVRNKSFNAFPGTLAYGLIKTSFEREIWRLSDEKSPTN